MDSQRLNLAAQGVAELLHRAAQDPERPTREAALWVADMVARLRALQVLQDRRALDLAEQASERADLRHRDPAVRKLAKREKRERLRRERLRREVSEALMARGAEPLPPQTPEEASWAAAQQASWAAAKPARQTKRAAAKPAPRQKAARRAQAVMAAKAAERARAAERTRARRPP